METLDLFGVITPDNKMKIPMILSDDHAHYLYETSCERMLEKDYERLVDERLAEEKAKKESHRDYIEKNYIRVGGN